MRILLQPSFILHRRSYLNTSLLLEVFSRDHGRLGIIARGAASPRSQLKGLLQPFVPLILSWVGLGELGTLTAAEGESRCLISLQQKNGMLAGLYANELLVRLLPRYDPLPELFATYQTLLSELMTAPNEEPALRRFEKKLLEELGYGLMLDREAVSGVPIVPSGRYRYILDRGPFSINGTESGGILISGQGLLALHAGALVDSSVLKEIKFLIRAALERQLCGRVLKTRMLYHRRIKSKT
jgi:DNA repair protein RecO (recombination protein O)